MEFPSQKVCPAKKVAVGKSLDIQLSDIPISPPKPWQVEIPGGFYTIRDNLDPVGTLWIVVPLELTWI